MRETWVERSEWQATPVFLPTESHGQRSLEGDSPWGREESDTTERLTHGINRKTQQFHSQVHAQEK